VQEPNIPAPIPLSLYIHLPWCIQKCPYCDFNSHALKKTLPEQAYLSALLEDFMQSLPLLQNRSIHSIFFGGGTPSLFSEKSIEKLLNTIQKHCKLNNTLEITLEANPGTLEHKNFNTYKTIGINRISLGAQTFMPQHLKTLGRIHNPQDIFNAIEKIHQAQFTQLNIDLMHGLPKQSFQEALEDLKTALDLSPSHLSWYQLTIEPNTAFYQKPPTLPNEDVIADMQAAGKTLLASNGFQHYEVSAFSKQTFACQHNLNYWQFGDYLGIGAGSHSKITHQGPKSIERIQKIKNPTFYLDPKKPFIHSRSFLPKNSLAFEFMLNALRLTRGFNLGLFKQRTFLPVSSLSGFLKTLEQKKLITLHACSSIYPNLMLTDLGARFLDDVVSTFLEKTHD
jgi:putative oxygen-independent coproporphyrinogen III oxidase